MTNSDISSDTQLTYLVVETENNSLNSVFDYLFEAVSNGGKSGSESVIVSHNEENN